MLEMRLLLLIFGLVATAQDDYGDILLVDTTGASLATAKQDDGVPASHRMALRDSREMAEFEGFINQAANELRVDASIIKGIISRETRAGKVLGSDGFGYDKYGYGLMQVDKRSHPDLQGGPYSLEHIKQGTGILINMIKGIKAKHPNWDQNMALKGGISAYNAGVGNVRTYLGMDKGTTNDDYANDVVARAQWYKNNELHTHTNLEATGEDCANDVVVRAQCYKNNGFTNSLSERALLFLTCVQLWNFVRNY